jgi:hypothetical protein
VPTFAPLTISRIVDPSSTPQRDRRSAVEHFNWECRHLGMQDMPCAMQELTGGCRGAPSCRTCEKQGTRAAPIAAPAGLVQKIKLACDANTSGRIV